LPAPYIRLPIGTGEDSGRKKTVRVDWLTLFIVTLAFAVLAFLWQHNIQTAVIRGLFYLSCVMLFIAGIIRFVERVRTDWQMTLRYQFLFVIIGAGLGYMFMQKQVQDYVATQTGVQLIYGYGLTDFTGGIVASPILITVVFLAAILFLIFVGPKVRRKSY
jgi:fatty acid desaturase